MKDSDLVIGEPVPTFRIRFEWHRRWEAIFDKQVELIRADIVRARLDGKLILYLSCPISGRGGGDHHTNVEIARAVERRLLAAWGDAFWVLNPAQYQMESKEGAAMIAQYARDLKVNPETLQPTGGDYMRMWTRVLVDDSPYPGLPPEPKLTAQHMDAFYFVGPRDVQEFFFRAGTATLTASIQEYFSRKFATDPDFRDAYSLEKIIWGPKRKTHRSLSAAKQPNQAALRASWAAQRREFLRFYALRASAAYSLGSHDEWEIFRLVNERRRVAAADNVGVAEQLAGFFDQAQIPPEAAEARLSRGYAR